MKMYLMQHGQAMSEGENPARPLTLQGKNDVERVAAWFAAMTPEIAEIRHSGKTRAEETAMIVARHVNAQDKVATFGGINPNDDVRPIAEAARQQQQSVMLVGHLPFLSRFASYVLAGDPEKTLIQFQMGGIACLDYQNNAWTLEWMIVPEMLT